MLTETTDHTTEDLAYLKHGEIPLMLRLYRPPGAGPFPFVVDLHGGAWTRGELAECGPRDEVLAGAGLAVAALDFRHAGDGYPSSLVDINYAIRWLKAEASTLRLDPGRVGLSGQSSGGHLAMLAAMRPTDPRYAGIPLAGAAASAEVGCVATLWPVINPLSRYRHALRRRGSAEPPAWTETIPERHDLYWRDEETMAEGSPLLALERGEAVRTPPALWVQGRPDEIHDYPDPESDLDLNEPERFAARYREAGGEIELRYVDQGRRSEASYEPLVAFFRKHLLGEG
ncbi:MAG: alpha/beta hydrolase [Alphaproteobacteria bacterium]|jgi:acetyl esterase/lipase|nr:alpha/beta hydrolase [Alphaproteobacteria bacterium]